MTLKAYRGEIKEIIFPEDCKSIYEKAGFLKKKYLVDYVDQDCICGEGFIQANDRFYDITELNETNSFNIIFNSIDNRKEAFLVFDNDYESIYEVLESILLKGAKESNND